MYEELSELVERGMREAPPLVQCCFETISC
jgi:hypothetical protein